MLRITAKYNQLLKKENYSHQSPDILSFWLVFIRQQPRRNSWIQYAKHDFSSVRFLQPNIMI